MFFVLSREYPQVTGQMHINMQCTLCIERKAAANEHRTVTLRSRVGNTNFAARYLLDYVLNITSVKRCQLDATHLQANLVFDGTCGFSGKALSIEA